VEQVLFLVNALTLSITGMQPYCLLLRASSEHILIVRALRAKKTVGCLPLLFHRPLHLAAGFAALDRGSSVMLLLAFGQPEFDLGKASLREIDTERNECESLLLRLAEEFIDFFSVEEQFPSAKRFVIHEVAMAVGTDMAMVEKGFAALYAGITIL
jgi:hypothetical protein